MPRLYPVQIQQLQSKLLTQKAVSLSVIRFDQLHPVVSGNKLFKLHYFLELAQQEKKEHIITFGGAYSNHLVATAYACKLKGLNCSGIVRGEQPADLSHTLQNCIAYGMQLLFVSREQYQQKDRPGFLDTLDDIEKNAFVIPEGGFHPQGAKGAAHMMDYVEDNATHIACAMGTATTLAGLLLKAANDQQIIAVPVLKGMTDTNERLKFLTGDTFNEPQLSILTQYHFGGYAKGNQQLFDFMNRFYQQHQLPTDFVYTGKLMFAVMDLVEQDYFEKGSKIVCMHTGGLQGNLSLQKGTLTFA